MKKGQLKALFIEAKGTGQKYIGVMIQTEGSSEPEVIINPKENFNAKFDYYMAAYDDDLILIAAKGKKDIRITGAAAGASFEDIQSQLIDEKASSGWNQKKPKLHEKRRQPRVTDALVLFRGSRLHRVYRG